MTKLLKKLQLNFCICHEIFVAVIFTQIRPVWISDLGTRPNNLKTPAPNISCLDPFNPYKGYSGSRRRLQIYRELFQNELP
jgi:hypothetical protein